ncbi:MAG: hypothetical protein QOF61_2447, partial [Acidobacteriota bacterium]|nr:hypothetical protein [Acidobacteriota bacterium]
MLLAPRRHAALGVSRLTLPKSGRARRTRAALLLAALALFSVGCSSLASKFVKSKVAVTPLLEPLAEADTAQLIAEINRVARVKSLHGKVDIQFLDTSFAKCGVIEKYKTADGDVTVQRPGEIYLVIQDPFVGSKLAEMSSNGVKFWVAVLKGDDKYRNFLMGTNEASYQRLAGGEGEVQCGGGDKKKTAAMQQRAVSAFSGLRPQHFTDALLVRPVNEGGNLIYARNEAFAEESDPRAGAAKTARVVHGYYQLEELQPETEGRARLLRRFWFDRFGGVHLSRVQTFDGRGQLTTDVLYRNPKPFGEGGTYTLPTEIE